MLKPVGEGSRRQDGGLSGRTERFGEDPAFWKIPSLKTDVSPTVDLRCGEKERKSVGESS